MDHNSSALSSAEDQRGGWGNGHCGMAGQPLSFSEVLEGLAEATWERLRQARRLNVSQGEETITDLVALEIARHGDSSAGTTHILKYPRAVENQTGADYYWAIGHQSLGWYRLAIQAKRIDHAGSENYLSLAKKAQGDTVLQADALDQFARQQRAWPGYVLYNFANRSDRDLASVWNCTGAPFDRPQLGCTVVPSSAIHQALAEPHKRPSRRSFMSLHKKGRGMPWRCLLCPCFASRLYGLDPRKPGQLATGEWTLPDETFTAELPPEFEAVRAGLDAEDVRSAFEMSSYPEIAVAERALVEPRYMLVTTIAT